MTPSARTFFALMLPLHAAAYGLLIALYLPFNVAMSICIASFVAYSLLHFFRSRTSLDSWTVHALGHLVSVLTVAFALPHIPTGIPAVAFAVLLVYLTWRAYQQMLPA